MNVALGRGYICLYLSIVHRGKLNFYWYAVSQQRDRAGSLYPRREGRLSTLMSFAMTFNLKLLVHLNKCKWVWQVVNGASAKKGQDLCHNLAVWRELLVHLWLIFWQNADTLIKLSTSQFKDRLMFSNIWVHTQQGLS